MTTAVGINGFGRIGRNYLRLALERGQDVAAINDITDTATLAHLLMYDSTYGRLDRVVEHDDTALVIDGRRIPVTAHRDPADLDWGAVGADIVIESTGKFRRREDAAAHLKAGARKVVLSAPGKNADATIVMGVNERIYDPDHHEVVSNASCTTNCVAPMAKVLHDTFGVVKGYMTTVHGYTNDQNLLDSPHKDLHRARSAAVNLIPTSTGAARSVGEVIPELAGRFDGMALRVPVEDGSLVDLACLLDRPASAEEINDAFAHAAGGPLAGIVRYNTHPIVSRDVIGDPASCVFDAPLTQSSGELVKVFGWYDNEWGYTCRLADLVDHIAERL
ncbi:type I glyceraldehyde-3-phosphate dehydrogenase [Actinomadura madurae]|uniref:type I glyceraldehyde-3-phosphate dehydrogenase n=1 Tax=Actinomadura madurae TaxID=1993 RepID=UPI0020275744|nr:type I glyceraldehyde-3-phosphate dehydrogenase [Actinomadura madurae]URM94559.1 type I glyceraldehyde-3-phosphate dehydrogenase [Actinomadura madurae]URN05269.1 type I glyceraldehyde-3-phosphate dehydrogenase [Actinomadura madurae]